MRDVAAIIGFGLLAAGCWYAWPPLGLIVPGMLLLSAAVAGHLRAKPEPKK